MSTLKRKDAPSDQLPAKSAKKAKENGLSKKDGKTSHKADKPAKAAAVVSLLKEEEPMFPRGGANVLTPLEQKQIQLEAKADAIREEEFGTGAKASKKKTSTKKSGKKLSEHKSTEDSIKIESLSFKVSNNGFSLQIVQSNANCA